MDLNKIYEAGSCVQPYVGRYSVEMNVGGYRKILEKQIYSDGTGTNHFPLFLLRHYSIKMMTFRVITSLDKLEIFFVYNNGYILDKLKFIVKESRWLGKLCFKEWDSGIWRQAGWFYFQHV